QLEQLEAQRRREAEDQLRRMRAAHPGQQQGAQAEGGEHVAADGQQPRTAATPVASRAARRAARARGRAVPAAAPKPVTVRRERPKLGRNAPCWCGSGKKYKNCHYREDAAASAAAAQAEVEEQTPQA